MADNGSVAQSQPVDKERQAHADRIRAELSRLGCYPTALGDRAASDGWHAVLGDLVEQLPRLTESDLFCLLVLAHQLDGTQSDGWRERHLETTETLVLG